MLHECQGHKHIVQLEEFFEEKDKFYLVFEKLDGGSLLDNIQKRGFVTESEASEIIKNLATGIEFLHNKGIAHRDLKPANILCENSSDITSVKICDFDLGSGIRINDSFNSFPDNTPLLFSPVGTLEYMAPEMVEQFVDRDPEPYDKSCDLWSLGVIMFVLLYGALPFNNNNRCTCGCDWNKEDNCQSCQTYLIDSIQNGEIHFPDEEGDEDAFFKSKQCKVSKEAKNLLRELMNRDAEERATANRVLDHTWITSPTIAYEEYSNR